MHLVGSHFTDVTPCRTANSYHNTENLSASKFSIKQAKNITLKMDALCTVV